MLAQYLGITLGIGFCAITFSSVCAKDFILVLYSSAWATENTVLMMKAQCLCLVFMSLNGMAEAFAYGLANKQVLTKLQGLLVVNSVIYVVSVVAFSARFGMVGLVYANCINFGVRGVMSLRISTA